MANAGGNPTAVTLGPGRLSYAPIGTAEPTLASALLPSAWQAVGYTENGTEIDISQTTNDILVAEEFDPVGNVMTARTQTLKVTMAEARKKNLLLAMGGGAGFTDDGTPFDFPDPSSLVPVMMVWDSDLGVPTINNRRWLFRSCNASGQITRINDKAPAKRAIATTFACVKPDATHAAVTVLPTLTGLV